MNHKIVLPRQDNEISPLRCDWCRERFGLLGGHWEVRYHTALNFTDFTKLEYCFFKEEDAVLFALKWA